MKLCKPGEADFQDQMRYIGFLIVALNKTHAIACNTIFVPSNKVTFFKYDFPLVKAQYYFDNLFKSADEVAWYGNPLLILAANSRSHKVRTSDHVCLVLSLKKFPIILPNHLLSNLNSSFPFAPQITI